MPQQGQGLGCELGLPGGDCEVMRALGELDFFFADRPLDFHVRDQQARAARVLLRRQLQCLAEVIGRCPRRMERERPLGSLGERLPGRLAERAVLSAGSPDEFERLVVVMREHLRPVLRAVGG